MTTSRVPTAAAEGRDLEALLAQSRRRLREERGLRDAIVDGLPVPVALVDQQGAPVHVNERWLRFARDNGFKGPDFGVSVSRRAASGPGEDSEAAAEIAAGLRAVLADGRQTYVQEYRCRVSGEHRWFRLMINALSADTALGGGAVVMHVDITDLRQAEGHMHDLAFRDALTGAGTSVALKDAVDRGAGSVERVGTAFLLLIDIIQFHDINEAHGYDVGDRLLAALARRLGGIDIGTAAVARCDGDCFAVHLILEEPASVETVVGALQAVIAAPFRDVTFSIQLDAQLAVVDLFDCHSGMEAFRRAELTLSSLRRRDNALWLAYSAALEEQNQARIRVSSGLRQALAQGEFQLHYQPKVEIETGRMVGAEGLIRWCHPTEGLVPPGAFIPVAESSQLIVPMGEWTIYQACRDLRAWQEAGIDIVQVSVNVSVKQFALSNVVQTVVSALEESGLSPGSLCLEITESVFADDVGYLKKALQELHALGVRTALDDFGTGYSSLQYLQGYRFDEIKVDQAFVNRISAERYSEVIVRMVNAIAETLDARVVAEGIETRAQRDALLAIGCELGQGYYYSMPLEGEDFTWLLSEGGTLPLDR